MKQSIFVRTSMTIPGAGSVIHVAELQELTPEICTMQRIIELDPSDTVRGYSDGSTTKGMQNVPMQQVPHPNTYHHFEDIDHEIWDQARFEALWAEAQAALG